VNRTFKRSDQPSAMGGGADVTDIARSARSGPSGRLAKRPLQTECRHYRLAAQKLERSPPARLGSPRKRRAFGGSSRLDMVSSRIHRKGRRVSLQKTKDQLIQLLVGADSSVIALSGKWGIGKTHLWNEVKNDSSDDKVKNALYVCSCWFVPKVVSAEFKKQKSQSEDWPKCLNLLVGARGFEPPTPCTPCKYATRLRYAPTSWQL
jgi:hypothetical protein